MTEGQISTPPPRGRLLKMTGLAFVAASVLVVLFVLPADYGIDPTGFGKLTGLDQLAPATAVPVAATAVPAASTGTAPAGQVARYATTAYRTDVIDIPLAANDGELEYKVKMKAGDTLTYSWTVDGVTDPMLFYFDFHSESRPNPPGVKPTVTEFLQTTGLSSRGALVAPFEGVHGWYLQNQSDKPVVVHLKVSGFYELIPPGEYGNLEGIKAKGQS